MTRRMETRNSVLMDMHHRSGGPWRILNIGKVFKEGVLEKQRDQNEMDWWCIEFDCNNRETLFTTQENGNKPALIPNFSQKITIRTSGLKRQQLVHMWMIAMIKMY